MKSKRIAFLVSFSLAAFALLALLAAACGGDDDTSKTASAGGTNASGATSSHTSGSKTAGADATSGGNAIGSGVKDLQQAAKDFKTSNFKITYEITNTDDAGKTTTGTLVMGQKGSATYFSAKGLTDDDSRTMTLIDDGKNSYMCTDSPEKTCVKSDTAGGTGSGLDLFSPAELLNSFNQDGDKVDKVADQTIAGHSAKCYKASGTDGGGTICLDKKTNLMLSVDGDESDGTKLKFVAKTISDSPSDNDFKPPYPIQTIPSN